MAHCNQGNSGTPYGQNPYAPGQPYSPGGDCCYPYGPGFPADPNAPTDGGCVPDNSDPCAQSELQQIPCPNTVCDDRFADLPSTNRLTLFGIVGRCFYRFQPKLNGFIVSDDMGQRVTNQPCVEIPFLKDYLVNPNDGSLLLDGNGDPVEGPVPAHDAMIATDRCGCQYRVQGVNGRKQHQVWDCNQFIFEDVVDAEDNPLLDPEDIPVVDADTCPEALYAALVPGSKTVVGDCGENLTVYGYRVGRLNNPGEPVGVIKMWGGVPDTIPSGYSLCDGTSFAVADWPDLFAAIGYAWGGGGATFNLPDFRGLIPRGVDIDANRDPDKDDRTAISAGGSIGNAVGSLQEDQMQCWEAEYDRYVVAGESVRQSTAGSSKTVARDSNQYNTTPIVLQDGGCGDPRFGEETRPKNVYVNFIIRTGCPSE